MTQKGQVTIPKKIRDALQLATNSQMIVRLDKNKGEVRLTPASNILDFAGKLVPKKNRKINAVAARSYMEKNYERS